jgi:hypothetical protein
VRHNIMAKKIVRAACVYVVTNIIIWRFWEAISVVYNGIFALLSVLICREKRLKESKIWRKVVEEP